MVLLLYLSGELSKGDVCVCATLSVEVDICKSDARKLNGVYCQCIY